MEIKYKRKSLHWLVNEYFSDSLPQALEFGVLKPPDQEIINGALSAPNGDKFRQLWDGDASYYPSRSEADLALCAILAFHTGGDPDVTDRLFRQSGLFRKKWDKKHSADGSTYGQWTIRKAIASLPPEETTPSRGKSEAQKLLEIAKDFVLFTTPLDEAYATITKDRRCKTLALGSKAFKNQLVYWYHRQEGRAPTPAAVSSTVDTLTALAIHEGSCMEVFTRVAQAGDNIFLFLGNDASEAIKITSNGWRVVAEYPVPFIKKPGMLPLPRPSTKGNLRPLMDFINVRDKGSKVLLASSLVGAAFPTGPYPILVLQGEQGSAKSTATRLIRSVLDPSVAPIRALPRAERDLAISAGNSWILAFDNISNISPWISDALCRLATGGGFATRKLYSDTDEIILDLTRPVILNGIAFLPPAHDLIDRAILIELAPIPDKRRRDENEMLADFEKALPGILGGLCDALSASLRNQADVDLDGLPRMADFAKRIVAAEEALPWKPGAFMRHYDRNRAGAVMRSLEGDSVAAGVMALMEDHKKWSGTASQLLTELQGDAHTEGYVPRGVVDSQAWPKAGNALSKRLKRAATFLGKAGIEISFPKRTASERKIVIKKSKG